MGELIRPYDPRPGRGPVSRWNKWVWNCSREGTISYISNTRYAGDLTRQVRDPVGLSQSLVDGRQWVTTGLDQEVRRVNIVRSGTDRRGPLLRTVTEGQDKTKQNKKFSPTPEGHNGSNQNLRVPVRLEDGTGVFDDLMSVLSGMDRVTMKDLLLCLRVSSSSPNRRPDLGQDEWRSKTEPGGTSVSSTSVRLWSSSREDLLDPGAFTGLGGPRPGRRVGIEASCNRRSSGRPGTRPNLVLDLAVHRDRDGDLDVGQVHGVPV